MKSQGGQQKQYSKMTEDEILKAFKVDPSTGLSSEEVEKRIEQYGKNCLEEEEDETMWDKIMEQFEDRFVRLLLLAAVISFVVSTVGGSEADDLPVWVEPSVIIAILIANGFIGIYQDYNALKATKALKKLQSSETLVLRDSHWNTINSENLVPGDYVRVMTGHMVPADSRVVKMMSLSMTVNQAPLTGETTEVHKQSEFCPNASDIQSKKNILFSGTLVMSGSAEIVLLSTGMETEIGEIQKQNQEAKEDTCDDKTPLGEKLDGFGSFLEQAIFWICVVIWLINIKNFWDPMLGGPIKGALYYFKIAVALAVAAIPEGLPAVITTCLALGTRRMTANNAIVKRLPSVETLGCTTVICSDKTGTLTKNEMVASQVILFGSNEDDLIEIKVESDSYTPEGKITNTEVEKNYASMKNLELFINGCCTNHTCRLIKGKDSFKIAGTATEGAILALTGKFHQFFDKNISGINYLKKLEESFVISNVNAFDSKRKQMSVLVKKKGEKDNILYIKGAPEKILDSAKYLLTQDGKTIPLNNKMKANIDKKIRIMTKKGLRVLGLSYKEDIGDLKSFKGISDKTHPSYELLTDSSNFKIIENDSVFIGLVGIEDPIRQEVPESIKICNKAGICVFMVTGDNKNTAQAVGKAVGLINESNAEKNTIIGEEFGRMLEKDPDALKTRLLQVIKHGEGMIFARTAPKHKRELVKVLKSVNQVVAMTGDGVNDSPALIQSNIGIAMGITGTEVAKDNSDMILIDDNFATIVKAVEEGRGIYENMKAFIRYMISSNIGEVISIFISSVIGLPDGFNSIQLLWVNLVTDGVPAMALSFNPPDADIMVKPPRRDEDEIVDSWIFVRYMVIGLYIGIATVGIFMYWYMYYDWALDGHSLVELSVLSKWTECPNWKNFSVNNFDNFDFSKNPCSYFTIGKTKASTLSLSVLVMIEMFNSFNAISENQSLLVTGIMINPYLILGVLSSIVFHCLIIYIPSMNFLFSTTVMNTSDWLLVIGFSFPVIIIDELLKIVSRSKLQASIEKRMRIKKEQ